MKHALVPALLAATLAGCASTPTKVPVVKFTLGW